jgi:hypothetical protein
MAVMFAKRVSNTAHFSPNKMGKSTVMRGEFLFVGLKAFEPGQEHAPHVHRDRTRCTSSWREVAWCALERRTPVCMRSSTRALGRSPLDSKSRSCVSRDRGSFGTAATKNRIVVACSLSQRQSTIYCSPTSLSRLYAEERSR